MSVRVLRLLLILLLAALPALTAHAAGAGRRAAERQAQEKLASARQEQAFRDFVASLWPDAEGLGISRATFDAAFAGVAFDPKILAYARNQPEFSLPIWRYVGNAVSQSRIAAGREAATAVDPWLKKAQAAYHVDAATIMGIWGIETEFGAFCGGDRTIQALATLAFAKVQGEYFRDELMAALVILKTGDVTPAGMKGSWAGAMGQTQFMPSNFLAYAVDFDGDGKRDIWNSRPDAIGSTANYLSAHGWIPDLPWGFEVRLPDDFKLTSADSSESAPFTAFQARGVERADGQPFPAKGEGRLMIVAGRKGPIFLVTGNFAVIKSYNPSTAYALAVALLGDAIMNGSGLKGTWPTRDRALAVAQVKTLQVRLKKLGFGVGEIDGKIGDAMRSAVRAYQERHGLTPDGYADVAFYKRISTQK